ncbi:hypothetical protein EYC59_04100 [Candidatus Saccharibacteria bacterium]|nr:MAG: hypothetical protein EYC59_04100 [Candidatus Saccharibacteria bacterium]
MRNRSNQSGFSAVEAILIMVVVAILGFTGWFVWNSQRQKTSESSTTKQTTKTTKAAPAERAVTIKEWGVKLKPGEAVKTLTYTLQPSPGTMYPTAYLTTSELSSSKACSDYYNQGASPTLKAAPSFQGISRLALTDKVSFDEGVTTMTAAEAVKQSPESYKQIGDFVYWYHHSNGTPCPDQTDAQSKAFEATFATLQPN